jgi:GNAT superfamily N-acetyltransferase
MGKYDALFNDYVPPVARQNLAGPLSVEQQNKDYALSRDPLAEGDADVSDPRWQRLTGNTPADAAERERQTEARGFLQFAGLGAAGELASPLMARGVGCVVDRARAIQASRAAARPAPVVSDPAAMAPVETGPSLRPRPDFWTPRDGDAGDVFETPSTTDRTVNIRTPKRTDVVAPVMGWLNAEGTKGGAIAAASKLESPAGASDGITFVHEPNPYDSVGDHRVAAMKDGKEIGHADVVWSQRGPEDERPMPEGKAFVSDVEVDPKFRRQGVASSIYAEAERETKRAIVPGVDQTPDGVALWKNGSPAARARAKTAKAGEPFTGKVDYYPPTALPVKTEETPVTAIGRPSLRGDYIQPAGKGEDLPSWRTNQGRIADEIALQKMKDVVDIEPDQSGLMRPRKELQAQYDARLKAIRELEDYAATMASTREGIMERATKWDIPEKIAEALAKYH